MSGPPISEAPAGVVYAAWSRRVAAELVDAVILAALTVGVLAAGGTAADVARAEEISPDQLAFMALVELAFSAAYAIPLLARPGARNGQTLGKQLLGIRIVRADARPVSYRLAAVRDVVLKGGLGLLSALHALGWIVVVDYLWPLWDPRSQTLHDKIVRTYVVRVAPPGTA